MAKKLKEQVAATADEPAFPSQSALHGVPNTGLSKFENIALHAMNGMLANPVLAQLNLTPDEIKDMIVTASLQYGEAMMAGFKASK